MRHTLSLIAHIEYRQYNFACVVRRQSTICRKQQTCSFRNDVLRSIVCVRVRVCICLCVLRSLQRSSKIPKWSNNCVVCACWCIFVVYLFFFSFLSIRKMSCVRSSVFILFNLIVSFVRHEYTICRNCHVSCVHIVFKLCQLIHSVAGYPTGATNSNLMPFICKFWDTSLA